MTYTERLIAEFERIRDKTEHLGLRKRSNAIKMFLLYRLICTLRNQSKSSLWRFEGRECRVPFRFKFERY